MTLKLLTPVAKPPWSQLGRRIESLCRKAIFEEKLFENVSKVGIALSGGKDSLTLLFMLAAMRGRGMADFQIFAYHVGGTYSCGAGLSTDFVKTICEEMGIPLKICIVEQKLETLACYSCSRKRRSAIFSAAKEDGVTTIAFGHHRDDSIGTLVMNLFHKGEFAANLAKINMVDYGVTIVRPLIYVSEEEIREFSKLYGFNRITYQCPVGQDSKRKQADQLMNQIEELFPNARENLARAGRVYGSRKAQK